MPHKSSASKGLYAGANGEGESTSEGSWIKEETMHRTRRALATLALSLALAAATTATAAATPPTTTEDPHGQLAQRKALHQSELDATLARHRALGALGLQEPGAQRTALYQSELDETLARHRALGALDAIATQPAVAAQPAARTDPAAHGPGVDVLASLLVGLVGGMLGGAAVMVGWTATTRRRRPRAAAGT
jgi:hypothetical protein